MPTLLEVIRTDPFLRSGYFHTAKELAVLAMRQSKAGLVSCTYSFLAEKLHVCVRTAQRHIQRLIDLGYLTKTVTRLSEGWYRPNTYRFVVPFDSNAPHTFYGHRSSSELKGTIDKKSLTLPNPKTETKRSLSLREEIRAIRKGLEWLTPGSTVFQASAQELLRLEALQRREPHE